MIACAVIPVTWSPAVVGEGEDPNSFGGLEIYNLIGESFYGRSADGQFGRYARQRCACLGEARNLVEGRFYRRKELCPETRSPLFVPEDGIPELGDRLVFRPKRLPHRFRRSRPSRATRTAS